MFLKNLDFDFENYFFNLVKCLKHKVVMKRILES